MTLKILVPNNRIPERQYIFDVIFREFLGVDYTLEVIDSEKKITKIHLTNYLSSKYVEMPDILFSISCDWLQYNSLPEQPLKVWDLSMEQLDTFAVSKKLPLIYAINDEKILNVSEGSIQLGIDIFGSVFFMLTRYEEIVKEERDDHNRFPAWASLAYQEGFLERPIVNEYLEILWWTLKRLWPRLERKQRNYRIFLSHDVDNPFGTLGRSFYSILKSFAGDVIKRKDFLLGTRRFYSYVKGNIDYDPNNTFKFIMDVSESHGLQSAFYFISDQSSQGYDNRYNIGDPKIRDLIKYISSRNHEIGLHPSYNTYRDAFQTRVEFENLIKVISDEGVKQNFWGGRQHFLRWENPITWRNWENVGLNYDSTLTFADRVGFRCGTCYEYSVFDLENRKKLELKESVRKA